MGVGRNRAIQVTLISLAVALGACSGSPGGETTTSTGVAVSTTARTRETTEPTNGVGTTSVPDATATTNTPTGTVAIDPPNGAIAGPIGVIGCSNTDLAVRGYTDVSDVDLLTQGDLGGGTMWRWGDPTNPRYGGYWAIYDERRPADGYPATWVQLCIRTGEVTGDFDAQVSEWAEHIVEQLRSRDPEIVIWFSAINSYGGGAVCSAIGADGPADAARAADLAASTIPGVSRGPDIGPLLPEHIGVRDDCHPNRDGTRLLGTQLVAFFD